MKSLIKSFFGGNENQSVEELKHVTNLQTGDMIELDNDFSLPGALRGQTLQVAQKTLYEYEDSNEIEWVLKNESDLIVFLAYKQDDGEESISFSQKLTPKDVESIFNLDEFATIFDDEYSATLKDVETGNDFSEWLGASYRRTDFCEPGYYHKSGVIVGQGEPFEYFSLASDCGKFGVAMEVWDGGETDVFLSIHKPLNIIKNYWSHKV